MDLKRIKKGFTMLDPTYQRVPCNVYLFCRLSKVKRKTCDTLTYLVIKVLKLCLNQTIALSMMHMVVLY